MQRQSEKKLGVVEAGRKGKWSGECFGRRRQTGAGEEMILRDQGTKDEQITH